MIRRATQGDIPRIKELWEEGFRDSLNYVDFFYSNVAAPSYTYLNEEGEGIVAMVTMLPARFVYHDHEVKVCVLMGAVTGEPYRDKGHMKSLLRHCEAIAREAECSMSVVVPGSRHLFDFFKKHGYSADFGLRLVKIRPGMLPRVRPEGYRLFVDEQLSAEKMFEMREAALNDIPHLSWNARQLDAILRDCRVYGEQTALCERGEERAFAVYGMHGKQLVLKECLGTSSEAVTELIRMLIAEKNPSSAVARLAVGAPVFPFEGDTVRFGMAKQFVASSTIRDMEPYMNLMFD